MEASPPILPNRVGEPAYQYSLFDDTRSEAIVNVASVPQRSPFRYPGGKTWLVPRIRSWLTSQPKKPHELIEPFAGGGIVSLTAIFENLVDCVTMVELDEEVAAVWKTVLSEDAAWLAQRIVTFSFTPESVHAELARPAHSLRDRAFQTLLRNRVNRGGILAPGSGRLKHGENGKGLASRWYPQTLKKRILPIAALRDRIRFIHGDGLQVLRDNAARSDVLFFIDPPYTVAGKKAGSRLYTHNEIDHEELFCIAEKLAGDFLMTYDNTEAVREMAAKHGFASLAVPMKTTHHAALTERLIGRDLRWT